MKATIELYACIDHEGEYGIGRDEETARESYTNDVGPLDTLNGGYRIIRVKVSVPLPVMLECDVEVTKSQGEFTLELSKGLDRFRAQFQLDTGDCTLFRVASGRNKELDKKPTVMKRPGHYHLRFANIDDRLTVWVDNTLPFGDGFGYTPEPDLRPTIENDLNPASIGTKGADLAVSKIKLWRDTYYTDMDGDRHQRSAINFGDPKNWDELSNAVRTYYVQPGHYLCLGDNSPESSDGRDWGLVPKRLLLGRAMMIYWPYSRIGRIQ